MQLLIVVFNRESITVAIEKLDAGVFEYLLGELLRIISEKGKGQLIFTSHNLRPLETLDKNFIAFTTNPSNRYIKLTNVAFVSYICDSDFSVMTDYRESWKFIRDHSLERYTNFGLALPRNPATNTNP